MVSPSNLSQIMDNFTSAMTNLVTPVNIPCFRITIFPPLYHGMRLLASNSAARNAFLVGIVEVSGNAGVRRAILYIRRFSVLTSAHLSIRLEMMRCVDWKIISFIQLRRRPIFLIHAPFRLIWGHRNRTRCYYHRPILKFDKIHSNTKIIPLRWFWKKNESMNVRWYWWSSSNKLLII